MALRILEHRCRELPDSRVVGFLDSQVSRGALSKGRSSSRALQPHCKRAAALQVVSCWWSLPCLVFFTYPTVLMIPPEWFLSDLLAKCRSWTFPILIFRNCIVPCSLAPRLTGFGSCFSLSFFNHNVSSQLGPLSALLLDFPCLCGLCSSILFLPFLSFRLGSSLSLCLGFVSSSTLDFSLCPFDSWLFAASSSAPYQLMVQKLLDLLKLPGPV